MEIEPDSCPQNMIPMHPCNIFRALMEPGPIADGTNKDLRYYCTNSWTLTRSLLISNSVQGIFATCRLGSNIAKTLSVVLVGGDH